MVLFVFSIKAAQSADFSKVMKANPLESPERGSLTMLMLSMGPNSLARSSRSLLSALLLRFARYATTPSFLSTSGVPCLESLDLLLSLRGDLGDLEGLLLLWGDPLLPSSLEECRESDLPLFSSSLVAAASLGEGDLSLLGESEAFFSCSGEGDRFSGVGDWSAISGFII